MRLEESIDLALHVPDTGHIVICARKDVLAGVTPVDGRDVMIVVTSVGSLLIVLIAKMGKLHQR